MGHMPGWGIWWISAPAAPRGAGVLRLLRTGIGGVKPLGTGDENPWGPPGGRVPAEGDFHGGAGGASPPARYVAHVPRGSSVEGPICGGQAASPCRRRAPLAQSAGYDHNTGRPRARVPPGLSVIPHSVSAQCTVPKTASVPYIRPIASPANSHIHPIDTRRARRVNPVAHSG